MATGSREPGSQTPLTTTDDVIRQLNVLRDESVTIEDPFDPEDHDHSGWSREAQIKRQEAEQAGLGGNLGLGNQTSEEQRIREDRIAAQQQAANLSAAMSSVSDSMYDWLADLTEQKRLFGATDHALEYDAVALGELIADLQAGRQIPQEKFERNYIQSSAEQRAKLKEEFAKNNLALPVDNIAELDRIADHRNEIMDKMLAFQERFGRDVSEEELKVLGEQYGITDIELLKKSVTTYAANDITIEKSNAVDSEAMAFLGAPAPAPNQQLTLIGEQKATIAAAIAAYPDKTITDAELREMMRNTGITDFNRLKQTILAENPDLNIVEGPTQAKPPSVADSVLGVEATKRLVGAFAAAAGVFSPQTAPGIAPAQDPALADQVRAFEEQLTLREMLAPFNAMLGSGPGGSKI